MKKILFTILIFSITAFGCDYRCIRELTRIADALEKIANKKEKIEIINQSEAPRVNQNKPKSSPEPSQLKIASINGISLKAEPSLPVDQEFVFDEIDAGNGCEKKCKEKYVLDSSVQECIIENCNDN